MKKHFKTIAIASILALMFTQNIFAATDTYTVQKGDTLWKISKKYQVGISEIISANKQFANPNMIYPGDKVYIPLPDQAVLNTQEEMLKLVNAERAKNGLKPLELDWQVSRVSQYKSDDMAKNNYFDHNSPTYGSPFDMLKQFNIKYRSAGENIAKGQKTTQAVMTAWMNSSGHRANILGQSYTHLGVGYTVQNGTTYWVQQFVSY